MKAKPAPEVEAGMGMLSMNPVELEHVGALEEL
jgi:hypothetical protein